ncbi:MAG: PAS domain S-box protein [Methylacidiphilales bacterium]|nr:PAS domain S-box protein [Candidatus Methylacidiphilales bacterium]
MAANPIAVEQNPMLDFQGESEQKPQPSPEVVEDIAERKKAEEISLHLRAVVESSDDAIISKTLDGIITSWNKGAERIFGYTASEVIGQPIYILFPPDRMEEEAHILSRIRRGERIEHYETERVRKDGARLDISLTISAIRDNKGQIIGASKIARNITERKKAEKALQEAQLQLGRHADELEKQVAQRTAHLHESIQSLESVCYTIAHDLRAPLRAIQGFTQILLEDYSQAFDDEGKRLAHRITAAATRMDALIRDLLEYAKLSHVDLPCRLLDLSSIVQKVMENLMPEIAAKKARIEIKDLPSVWGNETILEQVFTNLLSNALKFVAPETVPDIHIWSEKRETGVRVYIQDNGIGVVAEHHARIFEIFQRLHESEKQYAGTGVGLAIVKKGVERIGGKVGLDPRVVNGACFYLDLHQEKIP